MANLIAVTGASGWIGNEVCAWFEKNGHSVLRLTRTGRQPGSTSVDLAGELSDMDWSSVLRGCSAMVHCAAHVHRLEETPRDRLIFEKVNVEGTRRMVAACKMAGVERFVLASTIAVYDWTVPMGPRTEASTLNPTSAYARSKLEGERVVRESDLDWRIARLATVYGKGDRGNFSRLAQALRHKRFIIPGKGDARKSVLPIAKASELLARLLLIPNACRTIANLASPAAPSLANICMSFNSACGFPVPYRFPMTAMRLAARLGDVVTAAGGRTPINTEVLRRLTTDTIVDVTQMQNLFPNLSWESLEATLLTASEYYGNIR